VEVDMAWDSREEAVDWYENTVGHSREDAENYADEDQQNEEWCKENGLPDPDDDYWKT